MKTSKYIDHTILKPEAQKADIERICKEAVEHDFASVMVNPCWIPFVKEQIKGSDVLAACVVGFPLGANSTAVKVFEVKDAIANGADEVDMVINIGQLKDGNDEYVTDEIRQLKAAAGNKTLKVIIETCLLTDDEKIRACKDVIAAGADFVKTSTGFSTGGATVSDVKLMKEAVKGSSVKVKASGGVRSPEDFKAMIEAGAERIGTSSGCKLV
ncbi:deoxyribose-phosphate aldolase [Treponema sp. Marseille-Q3903]|uniref:deoxyribose-phosphate aldolase n=1 Tax=Treponema sp. Marseille-Q3903 TaxID=2766703 RepID=UPI00165215E0|nr:deoxyribose-phosphate aldolase [Treponema sp. Marseille-Q3903]MBC6712694.1 deoxyribose-phosphate aldolase [Treponema sp. Marseille-Q3903]